eukprot:gene17866-biopygen6007
MHSRQAGCQDGAGKMPSRRQDGAWTVPGPHQVRLAGPRRGSAGMAWGWGAPPTPSLQTAESLWAALTDVDSARSAGDTGYSGTGWGACDTSSKGTGRACSEFPRDRASATGKLEPLAKLRVSSTLYLRIRVGDGCGRRIRMAANES